MRIIAAFGLSAALALAFTFSVSSGAEAAKKSTPKAKMCTSSNMITGKKVSWKCGGAQKCCYDAISDKGTCVAASAICL